jgi:hypothetical protein
MKKALIVLLALTVFAFVGCTTLNAPVSVGGDGTIGSKTGQASGQIILNIFGDVDAGMVTAARNGGITRIRTVDFEVNTILLGVLTTYTTTVTGE